MPGTLASTGPASCGAPLHGRAPDARDRLQGAVRERIVRTTMPNETAEWPAELLERDFKAPVPNRLWAPT